MKKTAILLALLFMLAPLSACFAPGSENSSSAPGAAATDPNADVELTLPASVVEAGTTEELTEDDIESGIKSKKLNDDGSLTITIGRADYDELLAEMRLEISTSLESITDGETYPSIKELSYAEDFSELTLTVDRESFENSFDSFVILSVGLQCSVYRMFEGVSQEELHIKIHMQDAKTMQVYNTINFPESSGS